MLITRTEAGSVDFDPNDPTSGLVELAVPPGIGSDFNWQAFTVGYSAAGAPHRIELFLAPPGPVVPGGPRVDLQTATSATSITPCHFYVPVQGDGISAPVESWTVRLLTSGKTDTGTLTLSVFFGEVRA